MGTVTYMAPEQASGDIGSVGAATDVYALGVILYELLTGRRPFQGGTPTEILSKVVAREPDSPSRWRPELPRALDLICLKCLEKDPRRRYPTALDLAGDLERFVTRQNIVAAQRGLWERVQRWFPFKK